MIKNRCKKCGVSIKETGNHTCKSSWNKGLKGVQNAWNKNIPMKQETKNKISKSRLGKKQPNLCGSKNGMFGKKAWNSGLKGLVVSPMKGKKVPKYIREKNSGINNYRWNGGSNSINLIIRRCYEYRQWIQDILKRDNYTCQECGNYGCKLEIHHIKQFALIIKENNIKTLEEGLNCYELWNYDNGITLCKECHKKTDSYLKPLKT